MAPLVLASSSPRRRVLLEQIGYFPARIVSPDIDESPVRGELPRQHALRLAEAKARAVAAAEDEVVLAGDTTVAAGRRILPSATGPEMARQFLELLSGRRHRVFSAVTVIAAGRARSRVAESIVAFKRLSPEEIDTYVNSGEAIGKAGGYAIQGRGAAFVRYLAGSYTGVVGLPLYETRILLESAGLKPVDG